MYLVVARRQEDAVAMVEMHLTTGAHRNRVGKAGIVHMEKRVGTQMFGNTDNSLPGTVLP